jgi:hypothetical protein
MYANLLAASVTLALTTATLFAGSLVETELGPMTHIDATLVIVGSDGTETAYTPAMLEELEIQYDDNHTLAQRTCDI